MKAKQKAKEAPPQTKFWDGFQWVERLSTVPYPAQVKANPSTGTIEHMLPLSLGSQKDRRVYVGNLPPGMTCEALKEFSKFPLLLLFSVIPYNSTIPKDFNYINMLIKYLRASLLYVIIY